MDRRWIPLALAAALTLSACGGPEVAETTTPDGRSEVAEGAVLELVEGTFSSGELQLDCFLSQDGGPLALHMGAEEYQEAVTDLFRALAWQEEKEASTEGTGGSMARLHWGDEVLTVVSGADVIRTSDGRAYRAEGAGELCGDLLALWPGPEARYRQMPGVEYGDSRQSCAEQFLTAFGAYYVDSGAVVDFKLGSAQLLQVEAEEGHLIFRATYLVRPASPALSFWAEKGCDEEGWVALSDDIELMEDESGMWRCTYLNGWGEE